MATRIVWGGMLLAGFDERGGSVLHRDAGVASVDGVIEAVGPVAELKARYPDAPIHGGREFAITPGFINAHHHVGLTPLQLGSLDYPLELWFASRIALRDVDIYADTLFSAFEMIASGVTTVQHLHSRSFGGLPEMLATADEVISAYRAIGMRASYSMALRDQNRLVYEADSDFAARLPGHLRPAMLRHFARSTLSLDAQITLFDELVRRYGADSLIKVQIAPANLHWLSDRALEAVAEMAGRTGLPIHMHLLETPYQKAYALKRTGGSAVSYLAKFGLLGPRTSIGHGVWMDEDDIERCAHTGTRICHNCSSNFRLKSGKAPINRFLARGLKVAIGIDEAGINDDRDMLQEMRLVLHTNREPRIESFHPSAETVLQMATEHGAATTPFEGTIGRLSPGYWADLILFDWRDVTYPYQDDRIGFVDTLVRRAKARSVHSVMIAGEWVYKNRRFVGIDRDAMLAGIADALANPRSESEISRAVLADAVMPYVQRFYDGYLK